MKTFVLTRTGMQWISLLTWIVFIALVDYVDWRKGNYLIVAIQTLVYVGIFALGAAMSGGRIKIKFEQ